MRIVVGKSKRAESAFPVSAARRTLDVLVALILMVLFLPLLPFVALLIAADDGWPVFYRQVRLGQDGVPFRLLKLRTMRTSEAGPSVTAQGDPRITGIGRFLRRTSLDELPQVWHVLRGEMTLVGPRPESEALARRYPPSCRPILAARPGLTGPTQLRYREKSALPPSGWGGDVDKWYLDVMVPIRVQADLEYLMHPTLAATLHHLWLTAMFVVGLADLQAEPHTQMPKPESVASVPVSGAGTVRET
jgi:lipopolysaccharide/colanic/teichoic acid biosynthesis glycosyltransferase